MGDAAKVGRDAFIDAGIEAGLTKAQAQKLADQLGLIPKNVEILVTQSGAAEAAAQIARAAVDQYSTIWVSRRFRTTDFDESYNSNPGRALGGAVYGPGSGTSDTAGLFRLSSGEHVWTAAEVAKVGGQSAMYALRAAVRTGRMPGLAGGGQPVPQYAPQMSYMTQGPTSYSETHDSRLIADSVTIVSPDARSFAREFRTKPYKAKARPGR